MSIIKKSLKEILKRHKSYWSRKGSIFSSISGAFLFLGSLFVSFFASFYATDKASNSVNDLILSNTPVFNVDFIVNEGVMIFTFFIVIILLLKPKRIPFVLKSAALFIFIRSLFITLTHLGPFPEQSFLDPNDFMRHFNLGGDYFFSGHTGLPFLIALIFWDQKIIRTIALLTSIIFGVAVLLGHLHYSIDVFAAFFITYSIFHIAIKLFKKDFNTFKNSCLDEL